MKRIVALLCVFALVLMLAACAKPGEELIGKWRSSGGTASMTFYEDGDLYYSEMLGWSCSGSWSVSGNKLTLKLNGNETVYTYSVNESELVLSSGDWSQTWHK